MNVFLSLSITPTCLSLFSLNNIPTLANLFDLDYDPRLYLGTDLLSEDYKSMVVFADGSWKNELAYYDAAKDDITYFTDYEYDIEEIKAINKDIKDKMNISSKAVTSNYFNYLNDALEKQKIKVETTKKD